MKILKYVVLIVCFTAVISCTENEDDCSACLADIQKERVINFVNSAVNHINNVGVETAFIEFSTPNSSSEFIDEELYVFVIDIKNVGVQNAIMVAHGADESLIDTNVYDLQGENGKYVTQDFIEVVNNASQNGWSTYSWQNPSDDEIRIKHSYLVKIDTYIVGAGVYE